MLSILKKVTCLFLAFSIILLAPSVTYGQDDNGTFCVGTGVHDITGPAGEVVMMGYANTEQTTGGIHLRLRARAFIMADNENNKRVVFVSADLGQVFQGVKQGVMRKLRDTYGDLYTDENTLLSATHTHCGPGGHSHYALYNISSYGYIKQNYDIIVDGIYNAIVKAHNNLEPGYIEVNKGILNGTNINRSIVAYNNNDSDEKDAFDSEVDNEMVVLNFKNNNNELLGVLNWFPIHPTSMGNTNQLISSDNKGLASYLYEKENNTDYSNDKTFVAAFAQSDCGDVSPNIHGGEQGYGDNDFESTKYAGEQQYSKCKQLSESASSRLSGNIDYRHKYINFAQINISKEYAEFRANSDIPETISEPTSEIKTYDAAVGYSFACGAEDGPSHIDMFHEGMISDDYPIEGTPNYVRASQHLINLVPGLNTVSGVNYEMLWEQHYPKPVLFATSKGKPYPWSPEVLPIQIVKVGQLTIAAVPAEFTSMSGRRVKNLIKKSINNGSEDNIVVLAGLANAYSGYVATPKEYEKQHYEGASTHFGKWTLPAYLQEFHKLVKAIENEESVEPGPTPRDLKDEQMCFQTGVVLDNVPIGKDFGEVKTQVSSQYSKGDTVKVSFWTGHPKNDLKIQSTYLEVQKQVNGNWVTIANDWDWETKFTWKRIDSFWGTSLAIIEWDIPQDAESGTYRIVHHGNYKNGWTLDIIPFDGISNVFQVN
ncbi:MAG: neutral/alkaline ceramidase [Vallitalea sp.]|jgi:neutral ceramidase|nr:neutral/alkaline ceramidase [Vallitalea sp.]